MSGIIKLINNKLMTLVKILLVGTIAVFLIVGVGILTTTGKITREEQISSITLILTVQVIAQVVLATNLFRN